MDERSVQSVCHLVKPVGADVGFYFNLDATNVVAISEQGQSLGEEMTFALLSDDALSGLSVSCDSVPDFRYFRRRNA